MNSQAPMQHVRSPVQDVGSWLEIDGAAFEANVRNLLSMIDDRALLCAVVKSNAYGHGADLLLPFLVRLGVPFIGVGNNEEADTARRCGFEGRILRVRAAAPQEIKAGLRHDIEELIADPQSAWEIHKIATDAGKVVRIHLDINSSGISRHSLDVSSTLGRASAVAIVSHRGLQLAGIMTHFPKDDSRHIEAALQRFQGQALMVLQQTGIPREDVLLHCANSYAALHVRGSWLDMVRAGAVLYGDSDPRAGDFQRCLAFKARVASINSYAAGTKVGYGLTRTLHRDSRLAAVTAGYGDGYRRALASQGRVLIRGRRAAIIDIISMNSMVVDVTDVAEVAPGDEVVLFGRQRRAEIAPSDLEAANSAILADLYTVWAQGNRVLVNAADM